MPRISKLQRWLDLIAFLAVRRFPLTVDQLMAGVPAYAAKYVDGSARDRDSMRRAFERDKDELRAAGIPIETVRYRIDHGSEEVEGYQMRGRDFYLPWLKLVTAARRGASTYTAPASARVLELSVAEAALGFGALERVAGVPGFPFADAARSARGKLSFDLEPGVFADAPVVHAAGAEALAAADTVRVLSEALRMRKRVRFRYHGISRGETTERNVAPYGLLFHGGNWYLVGQDALRDAVRVFRVGRIEAVEPNHAAPKAADYAIPEDFDLRAFADRRAWELGDDAPPLRVEVAFRFPTSLWAERNGHGDLVEARDDGSAVRSFEVRQPNPFLRWVLGLAGEASVVSPAALRDELVAIAGAVAGAHENPAPAVAADATSPVAGAPLPVPAAAPRSGDVDRG